MKTIDQIIAAKKCVLTNAMTPGLSKEQKACLMGMSVALNWVAESGGGSTLDRLLEGEQLQLGKDSTPVFERFDARMEELRKERT